MNDLEQAVARVTRVRLGESLHSIYGYEAVVLGVYDADCVLIIDAYLRLAQAEKEQFSK